uniref:Uncharacterized protein n=1 Tax=Panstrongylus lignarius TaxID=156445 RepID=A0A224XRJ8_9HEMI
MAKGCGNPFLSVLIASPPSVSTATTSSQVTPLSLSLLFDTVLVFLHGLLLESLNDKRLLLVSLLSLTISLSLLLHKPLICNIVAASINPSS